MVTRDRHKWDRRFLDLASLIATWSKDRSTKVGAVIVDDVRNILSTGYNGFPRGVSDEVESRHERPAKYLYTEHAERNAIFSAARNGIRIDQCSLYCTHPTCANCARAIIQAGIKVVFTPDSAVMLPSWDEELKIADELLCTAGVKIVRVPVGS